MSMEIESIVKNLPTKKSLGLGGFTGEFYHTFEEEFVPFKTFPEIERKGILHETSITLLPKSDKDIIKKLQTYTSNDYRKNPQLNTT